MNSNNPMNVYVRSCSEEEYQSMIEVRDNLNQTIDNMLNSGIPMDKRRKEYIKSLSFTVLSLNKSIKLIEGYKGNPPSVINNSFTNRIS